MLALEPSSTFNPLSVTLKEHKFTGPNYIDWKCNLDVMLTAEEHKFLLTEICPEQPSNEATKEKAQAH